METGRNVLFAVPGCFFSLAGTFPKPARRRVTSLL